MPGGDVLLTIAEVAVAFAGFASIAVLFQQGEPRAWAPAIVIRLRTMIEGSLAALFSALLPFLLHHLGLTGTRLWSVASVLLAFGYAGFGIGVWRRSRVPLATGGLSRRFTLAAGGLTIAVVALLLGNAGGLPADRRFGVYLLGVTWSLVFTSLMFLRVVVFPSPERGA